MFDSFIDRLASLTALFEEFARQPGLVILAAFACFACALVLLFCDGLYTRRRRQRRPAAPRPEPPIAHGLEATSPKNEEPRRGQSVPDATAIAPAPPAAGTASSAKAVAAAGPAKAARARPKPARARTKVSAALVAKPDVAWTLVRELLPQLGCYSDVLRPQRTRLTALAHDGVHLTGEKLQAMALPEIRLDPNQAARLRDLDGRLARRFLRIARAYEDLRFALAQVPSLAEARPLEPEWSTFFLNKVSTLLEEVVGLVSELQKKVSVVSGEAVSAALAAER